MVRDRVYVKKSFKSRNKEGERKPIPYFVRENTLMFNPPGGRRYLVTQRQPSPGSCVQPVLHLR